MEQRKLRNIANKVFMPRFTLFSTAKFLFLEILVGYFDLTNHKIEDCSLTSAQRSLTFQK